jgi:hypothetical protein
VDCGDLALGELVHLLVGRAPQVAVVQVDALEVVEVAGRADGGHTGDAGLFGAENDLVELAGEAVLIEVTMGVEEGRHAWLAFAAAAGGRRSTALAAAAATAAATPPAPALATSRHLFGARGACTQQIV